MPRDRVEEEMGYKDGQEEPLEVIDSSCHSYAYVKTHQIVHLKYVQFTLC